MLEELGRYVEPSPAAVGLELSCADPLERGGAAKVWKGALPPDLFVNRSQYPGAHLTPALASLTCLAEDLVLDHAVYCFGALHDGEALLLPVPVLARAVPIGGDRAVRKHDFACTPRLNMGRGRRGAAFERALANRTGARGTHLFQEPRLPPAPTTLVVGSAGQVEVALGSSHRYVKQAALLGDHVLSAADERLEDRRRQLKARRPSRLGQPPFNQAWHEHRFELQAFGLMDGHDVDRFVSRLDRRRLLILSRQQDEVQVLHVSRKRAIDRGLTEFGDDLGQTAHIGRDTRGLTCFQRGADDLEVTGPVHE